jgi:cytochrome P450
MQILGSAVYRLTLHPLAKYPGPLVAALTDWYTVYHLVKGDRHTDFFELHRRYGTYERGFVQPLALTPVIPGKIVRFGPNRISINSSAALPDVYGANSNVKRSRVYDSTAWFFGGTPSSNTTQDWKEHAFRRRVNIGAMAPRNIKSVEQQMLSNIRYFCDHLIEENVEDWGSPKDMSDEVAYLVLDVMSSVVFSRSWNAQRSSEHRQLVKQLPLGVVGIHLVSTASQ